MINTLELIERIKYVLNVKTQSEIADYFSVSKKTVSEWKNGNSSIPYHRFVELSEDRGISLNWLFHGIGERLIEEEMKSINKVNPKYIVLDKVLPDLQRQQVKDIADYIVYAPPYFLTKVVEKLDHFKSECSNDFLA